jgi:hypothetical protein
MGYTNEFQCHFIGSRSWELFLIIKNKSSNSRGICMLSIFSLQTENLPWNTEWSPGLIPVSNLNHINAINNERANKP